MVDFSYTAKFESLPEIDPEELVQYFNLEFGLEPKDGFKAEDFKYFGIFIVAGIETMFWSVSGREICATVQPFEGSYMIGMDKCPGLGGGS